MGIASVTEDNYKTAHMDWWSWVSFAIGFFSGAWLTALIIGIFAVTGWGYIPVGQEVPEELEPVSKSPGPISETER
jgi:hypothetical protein